MNYNIFGDKAPMAPTLGKGTECIKLLCSQASNDMISPLIPMFFPALGAHLRNSEFLYPDQTWKETCGMMANLVAESGGNKGQLTALVEAICKDFRGHDEGEIRKLVEWQRVMKTRRRNTCHCFVCMDRSMGCSPNGPHRAIPGHAMRAEET